MFTELAKMLALALFVLCLLGEILTRPISVPAERCESQENTWLGKGPPPNWYKPTFVVCYEINGHGVRFLTSELRKQALARK